MTDDLDGLPLFRPVLTPAQERNYERRKRVLGIQFRLMRLCPWMYGPFLRLVSTFWISLIESGVVATCKPRWGALTFAYLNDGFSPSLWHTFWSVCGREDPGIYVHGAPRNKAEAGRIEAGLDPRYPNYDGV